MKVVIINKSDSTGGAAVVSRRLLLALRDLGVDASMLVAEKLTDYPFVVQAAHGCAMKAPFLAERLRIFFENGFNRADLFKVDSASDGIPLWKNPLVRDADVICLNWVNQGLLSIEGLKRIAALGKPIVWTMHDMWNFTGICHHAGNCSNWHRSCGDCRFLGKKMAPDDLSNKVWCKKKGAYAFARTASQGDGINFVAVSNWLADLARRSSLLNDARISVIPNAFPLPIKPVEHLPHDKFRIVMGAARLDDPVKGLPILIETTRRIRSTAPEMADNMELITFGNIKNPEAFRGIAISHCHLGPISGEQNIRNIYAGADTVISTSLYETLPGTLVEGLAYGCVPVAFNRGGQPDIIDHLKTGYIARWDDNPELAAINIAEGLRWAMAVSSPRHRALMLDEARKKFDASAVAKEYLRLFNRILQNPNSTRS
ncbi:MAG: glycosyltransferase [Muribaculaceae bacterium]|nr:glycosyltransferase [Muribaculaceae bacterium]